MAQQQIEVHANLKIAADLYNAYMRDHVQKVPPQLSEAEIRSRATFLGNNPYAFKIQTAPQYTQLTTEIAKKNLRRQWLENRDQHGRTLMHVYALLGHQEGIKEIIALHPASAFDVDHNGFTPMHYLMFAQGSEENLAACMTDLGYDTRAVNQFDRQDKTARQSALDVAMTVNPVNGVVGHVTAIKLMALKLTQDDQQKLLIDLAKIGAHQAIKAIFTAVNDDNHKATLRHTTDEAGNSLLQIALEHHHIASAKALIDAGINLNHANKTGNRPLHTAALKTGELAKRVKPMDKPVDFVAPAQPASFAKALYEHEKQLHQKTLHDQSVAGVHALLKKGATIEATNTAQYNAQALVKKGSPAEQLIQWKKDQQSAKTQPDRHFHDEANWLNRTSLTTTFFKEEDRINFNESFVALDTLANKDIYTNEGQFDESSAMSALNNGMDQYPAAATDKDRSQQELYIHRAIWAMLALLNAHGKSKQHSQTFAWLTDQLKTAQQGNHDCKNDQVDGDITDVQRIQQSVNRFGFSELRFLLKVALKRVQQDMLKTGSSTSDKFAHTLRFCKLKVTDMIEKDAVLTTQLGDEYTTRAGLGNNNN